MRETPVISAPLPLVRPGTVTAALWVGWVYQALTFGIFFLFYIPRKQAYLDSFVKGRKVDRLLTQEEINMVINPNATLVGEVAGFVVGFAVTAFFLRQMGLGLAWARVALAVWFLFRIALSFATPSGGWMFIDILPQTSVILLMFLPSSRRWFS